MSGIYLHIPFCKQACHYCDFHFSTSLRKKDEIINAIATELVLRKNELSLPIETIYFGGGTPSVLSPKELNYLLKTVRENYNLIESPEITLEANPDDLSSLMSNTENNNSIFKEYKSIGINRLSIGIQSFFQDDLSLMNRAHNEIEAKVCLEEATKYFDNITIDLIYGMPNMSNEKWIENINIALKFGINHISSYALTVEPKTALSSLIAKGKIAAPKDDVAHDHFQILVKTLEANNFIHYELSNFGKSNYFSKHNTSYWKGKSYLGVGPSAHSFNGEQRSWNVSNNAIYLKNINNNSLPIERETLSLNDRYNEYVMTGLRTIYGISLLKIEQDFGKEYVVYLKKTSQKFIDQGMLSISGELNTTNNVHELLMTTTQKGKFLCDGIASDLFIV